MQDDKHGCKNNTVIEANVINVCELLEFSTLYEIEYGEIARSQER